MKNICAAGCASFSTALYAWVRDSSGYVASKTCQITYCTGTEISKSGMTASGHTNDRDPSRMIDT